MQPGFSANASNSDEYGGISSASKVAADRTNSKIYFFISLFILKMVPVFQLCETGFFIKSTIRPKSTAETGFLLYRGNRKYPLSPAASSFPEDAIFPSGEVVVLQKNFPLFLLYLIPRRIYTTISLRNLANLPTPSRPRAARRSQAQQNRPGICPRPLYVILLQQNKEK